MKDLLVGKVLPAATALAALAAVAVYMGRPARALSARVPGTDRPAIGEIVPAGGDIVGTLTKGDAAPSDLPGEWGGFRGSNRDGISTAKLPLAKSWPTQGPKPLWGIDVGEGHAGAAVLAGRVCLLDYDRQQQADVLRCLSLANGGEIWRYSYGVQIKRNHGMSRTVPAVTDKYVVSLGPKCHVTCLDSSTGRRLWAMDLVRQFAAKVPQWYAGQCPLIDGDRAIIAPGGSALMVAVNCATGGILWKTPNPNEWEMTHSSIMPMEIAGRRTYVYCASGGVVGVDAADGKLLWEYPGWKIQIANVPSPLALPGGRIFLCGGYNAGSMILQVEQQGGQFVPREVLRLKAEVFGSGQHTPILHDGHIYGVRPDGQMVCMDTDGNVVWTSGSGRRFGIGPFLLAGGMIYAMDDMGVLTLIEATPRGYRRLAEAKVLPGTDAWAPMAMAGGRLIVRDLTRMVCLDVAEH